MYIYDYIYQIKYLTILSIDKFTLRWRTLQRTNIIYGMACNTAVIHHGKPKLRYFLIPIWRVSLSLPVKRLITSFYCDRNSRYIQITVVTLRGPLNTRFVSRCARMYTYCTVRDVLCVINTYYFIPSDTVDYNCDYI